MSTQEAPCFKPDQAQRLIDDYITEWNQFLGREAKPVVAGLVIDHIGFKAWNREWYQNFLKSMQRHAGMPATIYHADGRDLATIALTSGLGVGGFGRTAIVEVMEIKPAKALLTAPTDERATLDHIELWGVTLEEMQNRLIRYGIPYDHGHPNPDHKTLLINFGNNRELKITDQRLVHTSRKQLRESRAKQFTWD